MLRSAAAAASAMSMYHIQVKLPVAFAVVLKLLAMPALMAGALPSAVLDWHSLQYELTWTIGGKDWQGMGVADGDFLAAASTTGGGALLAQAPSSTARPRASSHGPTRRERVMVRFMAA